MSNRLKMATIQSILSLHEKHWSYRRIARALGIHRETVSRYVRLAAQAASPAPAAGLAAGEGEAKPANAPIGSWAFEGWAEPADHPAGGPPPIGAAAPPTSSAASAGRQSDCEPWREWILAKHGQGLSVQRIFQDLLTEQGAKVSYDSVRRFLRRQGGGQPLPFRRMECAAGEEAQVDFGSGAWVTPAEGKRRRPHLFRLVLSFSRKGYSEVSWRQTTEDFIRCLENAFWAIGGVPKVLVIDNLRAAVQRPDWYDPELNPKLQAFCRHYGLVILPTKPRMPRHKGKVERGVVHVFNHRFEQIAVHPRREPGRFSTLSQHIPHEKISGVERGAQWLLDRIRVCGGPHCLRWAEAVLAARGIAGVRVLQGLRHLAERHPQEALEKACQTALSYGAYHLRTIRELLRRQATPQPAFALLEEHELIRPLAEYTAWLTKTLRYGGADFRRHGWAKACSAGRQENGPEGTFPRGPAEMLPPRSGYPSLGCVPAEPNSVSPDIETVVPPSPVDKEISP